MSRPLCVRFILLWLRATGTLSQPHRQHLLTEAWQTDDSTALLFSMCCKHCQFWRCDDFLKETLNQKRSRTEWAFGHRLAGVPSDFYSRILSLIDVRLFISSSIRCLCLHVGHTLSHVMNGFVSSRSFQSAVGLSSDPVLKRRHPTWIEISHLMSRWNLAVFCRRSVTLADEEWKSKTSVCDISQVWSMAVDCQKLTTDVHSSSWTVISNMPDVVWRPLIPNHLKSPSRCGDLKAMCDVSVPRGQRSCQGQWGSLTRSLLVV